MKDYYSILALNDKASDEEIKKAYRKLSKKYHPDLNPNSKSAESNFKDVSEAYAILTGKQKPKNENPFGGNPFGGNPFGGNPFTRNVKPIKVRLTTSLEEIFNGSTKEIQYKAKEACFKCNGEGGHNPQTCNQCGGRGHIQQGQFMFVCNNCNGLGSIHKTTCYTCQGEGSILRNKKVNIKIPKGVTEGTVIRYPKIGDFNKGTYGDVYFYIEVKPHKIFTMDGLNLKRDLEVPIIDILLGSEKEFETLSGLVKIKIPKLSDLDKTFRLKAKGFHDEQTNIIGDMYVKLKPQVPKKLTPEEENKLKELKLQPNFNI